MHKLINIRDHLIKQRRENRYIRAVTKSVSNWIKDFKINTKIRVEMNTHNLEHFYNDLRINYKAGNIVCYSEDIKFSKDEIRICKESWFVTYDSQTRTLQLYNVHNPITLDISTRRRTMETLNKCVKKEF